MVYRVDVKHVSHFLKEVLLFQWLSARSLDRVAALCEERSFRAGEYLGVHNQTGDQLYIVREGEVTMTTGSDEKEFVVRTLREHETFPLAALAEPPLLVTTARAATDGEAFVIPRVRLLELCELEPKIGLRIYQAACAIVMSRYRHALQTLDEHVSPAVYIGPTERGTEV